MSGEYSFGASDDIVRRIRENLPHIEWEQPLSAERERLAADEIVRLRTRLQACQSNDDYPLTDDCITQTERFLLADNERLRQERQEAAAEIERLRAEVERLQSAGDALATNYELMLEQDWSSFLEAFLYEWKEARRG